MAEKLTLHYDRTGDILYISKTPPYETQDSEELGDEVIARLNPDTHEVESLEILFFSARIARNEPFEVPVGVDLRLVS